MDPLDEQQTGESDPGTDVTSASPPRPAIILTVGGTDAGPATGPNPAIGTPRRVTPSAPPAVIHAAGDAHPGEANPARADVDSSGEPAVETARLLADRESGEDSIPMGPRVTSAGRAGGRESRAADAVADPTLARDEQEGRGTSPEAAEPLEGQLPPLEALTTLGMNDAGLSGLTERTVAMEQQHGEAVQRATSPTGTDAAHSPYDRLEYGAHEMNELRDDVLVGANTGPTPSPRPAHAVNATFADAQGAQRAIAGLQNVGIGAADITLVSGRLGRGGEAFAGVDQVVPAGEGTYRRSAPELPNDEDLPATVQTQTGEPPAGRPGLARPPLTASARGGLARDEGLIGRVDRPADAEIYSDFARSDADYRTVEQEEAGQSGGAAPRAGLAARVQLSVRTDRLNHEAVVRVLRANGAEAVW